MKVKYLNWKFLDMKIMNTQKFPIPSKMWWSTKGALKRTSINVCCCFTSIASLVSSLSQILYMVWTISANGSFMTFNIFIQKQSITTSGLKWNFYFSLQKVCEVTGMCQCTIFINTDHLYMNILFPQHNEDLTCNINGRTFHWVQKVHNIWVFAFSIVNMEVKFWWEASFQKAKSICNNLPLLRDEISMVDPFEGCVNYLLYK